MCDYMFKNLSWIIPTSITIVLAIVNGFYLASQRKQQKIAICVSLMEKRMEIYYNINKVLSDICMEGNCTNQHISEFTKASRDVEMLFGKDVVQFKDNICETLRQFKRVSALVNANIESRRNDPNHSENCKKDADCLTKVSDALSESKKAFAPYIDFSKIKIK